MSSKKPYLPNNWEGIKEIPEEYFPSPTFEEVMDKFMHWELPTSVACIIRATDRKTKRITEHRYLKNHAAQAKFNQLLNKGGSDLLVMEQEDIHYVFEATGKPGFYGEHGPGDLL